MEKEVLPESNIERFNYWNNKKLGITDKNDI
jgi:hypothetical protein